LFFFKSYVASYSYVRRPGTDRISEEVNKKLRRNRNRDSCGKSATGTENTGIRRIPAGICNLGAANETNVAKAKEANVINKIDAVIEADVAKEANVIAKIVGTNEAIDTNVADNTNEAIDAKEAKADEADEADEASVADEENSTGIAGIG